MTRSRNNKMISGVCAGIANQIGIGAFWVRFFFVIAAAVIPGVSLLMVLALYVLLAMVLPWDENTHTYRY